MQRQRSTRRLPRARRPGPSARRPTRPRWLHAQAAVSERVQRGRDKEQSMEITRVWEEEGGHASPAAIECKHVGVCVQGRWTRRSMLPMLAQCDATRAFVCLRTRTSTHNTADFAGGRSDAVETRADLDRKRFLRHHVSRHACINTHTHTHTHTHTTQDPGRRGSLPHRSIRQALAPNACAP